MINPRLPKIFYGGDYNPEQWPEAVWDEDMRLMKQAGVNLVSIAIFSWATLQPDERTYCFDWLDRLLDKLAAHGIFADLATASASQPAWVSVNYPDVLPVDQHGNRISHGSRQSYCPNSPTYRRLNQALVRRLAERYRNHPALVMWHINNEYACHTAVCYCDNCALAFRKWLQQRYGSVARVNEAWGTDFWSQTYYQWPEIIPPRRTSTFANPGQVLDYQRFMSDSLFGCCQAELAILKEITPTIPVTTNFMGDFKPLDYFQWAEPLDVVSWDSYPNPAPEGNPAWAAFNHDLMRGLKDGQPFVLMEQAPSQVNWRSYNPNKRPGVMRLWSYQALARGADGIMFFQWRQSRKGAEKFHSAMINAWGDEQSRVYREVVQLGNELAGLAELLDATVPAQVAIVFDYENWWAVEFEQQPSVALQYLEQIRNFYEPLFAMNIPVRFVAATADLKPYQLVIAPLLYMVKPGVAERIERYVAEGGTFVTTCFSGIVDATGGFFPEGYTGPLQAVLGLRVAEFDALEPQMSNGLRINEPICVLNGEYRCRHWCDIVKLDTATAVAEFTEDYYSGSAAVTVNRFQAGLAYYIATQPEPAFYRKFIQTLCVAREIIPTLNVPQGVEAVKRVKDGQAYLFVMNHNDRPAAVLLPEGNYRDLITGKRVVGGATLEPTEVLILKSN